MSGKSQKINQNKALKLTILGSSRTYQNQKWTYGRSCADYSLARFQNEPRKVDQVF